MNWCERGSRSQSAWRLWWKRCALQLHHPLKHLDNMNTNVAVQSQVKFSSCKRPVSVIMEALGPILDRRRQDRLTSSPSRPLPLTWPLTFPLHITCHKVANIWTSHSGPCWGHIATPPPTLWRSFSTAGDPSHGHMFVCVCICVCERNCVHAR